MRILFLSRWYPYPPDNGSKLRVLGLLQGLCERHDVTLISFCDGSGTPISPVSPAPALTHVCPYREFAPRSGRALLGYSSRVPRFLVDTHSLEMEALIRDAVRATRYDLVIASQLPMAAYYESFRGIPSIFEEAELGTYLPADVRGDSPWTRARRGATWAKHRRYMSRLLRNFLCCTVVSGVERGLLAAAVPDYQAVHVVPNSVEMGRVAEGSKRKPDSLIFAGSLRYGPNRDAMTWFLNDIFPSVRAKCPGARLTITGEPGPVVFPAAPEVVLTGRVADVRSLVAASAVSLAPIRAGGGTRLKILEAMALRTPVVATTKAAEGLDVRDGEHVLIADTPCEFAEAVSQLLRNPAAAHELADRAWRLCEARYEAGVVTSAFVRLVGEVAA
jgi:polysaccharide biosynthesis protein PslH